MIVTRQKITKQEAKDLALVEWLYLAEHPEIYDKQDLPEDILDRLYKYGYYCTLCALYCDAGGKGCSNDCPLALAGEACQKQDSAYKRWNNCKENDYATREKMAKHILSIIQNWDIE